MGLTFHSYEPTLNGEGRELVVRKDCYDQRVWDSERNLPGTRWANSDLLAWLTTGYKSLLSTYVQEIIGNTSYRFTPEANTKSVNTRSDPIFSLSCTEIGLLKSGIADPSDWTNVEGSTLPIGDALKITYWNGAATAQWTRTPCATSNISVFMISTTGEAENTDNRVSHGSRPCFTLPADTYIDMDKNLVEPNSQLT